MAAEAADEASQIMGGKKAVAVEANRDYSTSMNDAKGALGSAKNAYESCKRAAILEGSPIPEPPAKLRRLMEAEEAETTWPPRGRGRGRGGRGRGGWSRGRGGRGISFNFF
jgi:hypothetical protein